MDNKNRYLGDGVYVEVDVSGDIKLYTSNGYTITNEIILDTQIATALVKWLKENECLNIS